MLTVRLIHTTAGCCYCTNVVRTRAAGGSTHPARHAHWLSCAVRYLCACGNNAFACQAGHAHRLTAARCTLPFAAQIGTVRDPELRVQIVSERSTFDEDPAAFHKRYAEKQVGLGRALCCPKCLKVVKYLYSICSNTITLTLPATPALIVLLPRRGVDAAHRGCLHVTPSSPNPDPACTLCTTM